MDRSLLDRLCVVCVDDGMASTWSIGCSKAYQVGLQLANAAGQTLAEQSKAKLGGAR
jgi:hypothetical protein